MSETKSGMSNKVTNLNLLVKEFILLINKFNYKIELDPEWEFIYSNGKRKWFHLSIIYYKGIYTITQSIGEENSVVVKASGNVELNETFYPQHQVSEINYWIEVIDLAIKYLKVNLNDTLKCYLDLVEKIPYKYRSGIIRKSLLWHFDNTLFRFDKKLKNAEKKLFCKLVEDGTFAGFSNTKFSSMTADRYFDLCKIVYLAYNLKLDEDTKRLSGRALYKRFADGRHEGLLDIKGNSVKEFNDWLNHKHPKYNGGGHPWEILRNRYTFSISDRTYSTKKSEYELTLIGISSNYMSEYIRAALALYAEGIIVKLGDFDRVMDSRDRLLGLDYVGIIPFQESYEDKELFDKLVSDTITLEEIKTSNKSIIKAIQWNDIPFIYPN